MAKLVYDLMTFKVDDNSLCRVYFENGELVKELVKADTYEQISSEIISCTEAYTLMKENEVKDVKSKVFTALDINKKQYLTNTGKKTRPDVSKSIREKLNEYHLTYSDFKWYYLKIKKHMLNQINTGKYDAFNDFSKIFYT